MHTKALPNKTPYKRIINPLRKIQYDMYTWGRDVHVKIKKAKWICYSVQSIGHWIYWPDSLEVSVEKNVLFNKETELAWLI